MLLGVNYLHNKKIAHRDLKPENFMFKEIDGQELKLIDFGLSTNFRKNEKLNIIAGSPYYISPEVLDKNYTQQCDVWSLGVIFYQMVTGKLPFNAGIEDEIGDKQLQPVQYKNFQNLLFGKILSGHFDRTLLQICGVSQECASLIQKMLRVGESSRPTCLQILQDDYFKPTIEKIRTRGCKMMHRDMLQNMINFLVSSRFQREIISKKPYFPYSFPNIF